MPGRHGRPKRCRARWCEEPCGQALFGILVEGLADRFEPALCDAYARLFSQAVAHAMDGAGRRRADGAL